MTNNDAEGSSRAGAIGERRVNTRKVENLRVTGSERWKNGFMVNHTPERWFGKGKSAREEVKYEEKRAVAVRLETEDL